MTTDIQNASGNVEYYHHVHSLNSTDEYVFNNTPNKTTDGFADDYVSDSPNGCFTQAVFYVKRTETAPCPGIGAEPAYLGSFGGPYGNDQERNMCQTCGYVWTCGYGSDAKNPTHNATSTSYLWVEQPGSNDVVEKTAYKPSCGYLRGEVMRVVITY